MESTVTKCILSNVPPRPWPSLELGGGLQQGEVRSISQSESWHCYPDPAVAELECHIDTWLLLCTLFDPRCWFDSSSSVCCPPTSECPAFARAKSKLRTKSSPEPHYKFLGNTATTTHDRDCCKQQSLHQVFWTVEVRVSDLMGNSTQGL